MVAGAGTDGALTRDHKPDLPDERARIERAGGVVEVVKREARVNGELAVSRAFGDARYKKVGVTCEPEMATIDCEASDFLVLVCDGIVRDGLANRDVVGLVAAVLRAGGPAADAGAAAAAVCRRAFAAGSRDNLSCLVVQLAGGAAGSARPRELQPGPFAQVRHAGFRRVYAATAERAGMTLAGAVELRFDEARRQLDAVLSGEGGGEDDDAAAEALSEELAAFGGGPAGELAPGSAERRQWFSTWLDGHALEEGSDPSKMSHREIVELLERRPELQAEMAAKGKVSTLDFRRKRTEKIVRVGPLGELRAAMTRSPACIWDDEFAVLSGRHGLVVKEDLADKISKIKFLLPNSRDPKAPPKKFSAWLPTVVLTEVSDPPPASGSSGSQGSRPVEPPTAAEEAPGEGERQDAEPPAVPDSWSLPSVGSTVVAPPLDDLKAAVEITPGLGWFEKLKSVCGKKGVVAQHDLKVDYCMASAAFCKLVEATEVDGMWPKRYRRARSREKFRIGKINTAGAKPGLSFGDAIVGVSDAELMRYITPGLCPLCRAPDSVGRRLYGCQREEVAASRQAADAPANFLARAQDGGAQFFEALTFRHPAAEWPVLSDEHEPDLYDMSGQKIPRGQFDGKLKDIEQLPPPERWIGQAIRRADREAKRALDLHPRASTAEWQQHDSSIESLEMAARLAANVLPRVPRAHHQRQPRRESPRKVIEQATSWHNWESWPRGHRSGDFAAASGSAGGVRCRGVVGEELGERPKARAGCGEPALNPHLSGTARQGGGGVPS
ncbi:unnamed protein product [Prorocentrum cordatum]|nr:unnamed protein product [Polarella glacialis]